MTGVSTNAKLLAKEGAWEMIGKGFSAVGKLLSSLGGGLVSAILVPIAIVLGIGIVILISVKVSQKLCYKICTGCCGRKKADMSVEARQHDAYLEMKRLDSAGCLSMATTWV